MTDFFDYAMTNFNEQINVTCCGLDGSEAVASCGGGLGCSAVCASLSSTLCPSGDCNNCHAIEETIETNRKKKKNSCTAASGVSCLNRCVGDGCKVGRGSEHCCFQPSCKKRRRKKCAWTEKYFGESCPKPGNIPKGEWICPAQDQPITNVTKVTQNAKVLINSTTDDLPVARQDLQCHLECQPGHVPNLPPSITCVRGKFEPAKPSEFVCEPAALLMLSRENELSVFTPKEGKKCNKKLPNTPPSVEPGMSISLFKNHLVIAGFQTEDASWKYHTLADARGSLLAATWNTTATIGEEAPKDHTSYTFARSLVLVRGEGKEPMKLDMDRIGNKNGSWVQIKFKNETSLVNDIVTQCGVKTNWRTFITFGGRRQNGEVVPLVLIYNKETEEMKELPPMKYGRTNHACVLVDHRRVLITGGRDRHGAIVQDEVYDLVLQYSTVSTSSMATPRYDHSMALLGETVLALGGRDASGAEIQSVERYSPIDGSWEMHPESLLSNSTGGLATTLFPQSALDCDVGCQCGNPKDHRIIGGTEAEVSFAPLACDALSQENSAPWIALLLVADQEPMESSCSATLVSSLQALPAITTPLPRLAPTGP